MDEAVLFRSLCQKNRYSISDLQFASLQKYVTGLLDWNKKINLISRKDEDHVWTRHVLGSIALLFQFQFLPGSRIIDIGTGGGLPGIPLGILSEDLEVTLVDSIQKKIRAVTEIISSQGLGTMKTVCGRIEELNGKQPLHKAFDYVIARGVGAISDILKWSTPLLRPSVESRKREDPSPRRWLERGSVILLKGGDLTLELEQARVKQRPREINSYPVIIDGIDPSEMVEKKIVIIRP
jgi:16S rRNA (guanine527-N7)-methyltransferase